MVDTDLQTVDAEAAGLVEGQYLEGFGGCSTTSGTHQRHRFRRGDRRSACGATFAVSDPDGLPPGLASADVIITDAHWIYAALDS
jgi:hypothetical protein